MLSKLGWKAARFSTTSSNSNSSIFLVDSVQTSVEALEVRKRWPIKMDIWENLGTPLKDPRMCGRPSKWCNFLQVVYLNWYQFMRIKLPSVLGARGPCSVFRRIRYFCFGFMLRDQSNAIYLVCRKIPRSTQVYLSRVYSDSCHGTFICYLGGIWRQVAILYNFSCWQE